MVLEVLKINRTKQFLKDFSKIDMSDQHYSKFIVYLSSLIKKEVLQSEALDHSLNGEYIGFREFHVSGDLLVIYKITEDTLYLTRIGSHSQLFK